MLKGKRILLGVTGSIAAYKAAYLVRMLRKEEAEVKIIMTEDAAQFISSLTLSTLAGTQVHSRLYDEEGWVNHALLGRWADLMIIAPATCNTISKLANGQCDNLLTAVYLSSACPVMVAPAMDEDMWLHPATQRNVERLKRDRVTILGVNEGELASGLSGSGRMKEPEEIVDAIIGFFQRSKRLSGKKVLITAGPTIEPIDPVRYISNHSSGKMGVALANAASMMGAEVYLVMGPANIIVPSEAHVINVQTAADMYSEVMEKYGAMDYIIMAAAVADYTPEVVSSEKIKKKDTEWEIKLKPTRDILAELGKRKKENQILVGFALETKDEKEYALAKLRDKKADFIILNSLREKGAGFQTDTNKVYIFGRDGSEKELPLQTKEMTAIGILNYLTDRL